MYGSNTLILREPYVLVEGTDMGDWPRYDERRTFECEHGHTWEHTRASDCMHCRTGAVYVIEPDGTKTYVGV